jgi:hypothetical protein
MLSVLRIIDKMILETGAVDEADATRVDVWTLLNLGKVKWILDDFLCGVHVS